MDKKRSVAGEAGRCVDVFRLWRESTPSDDTVFNVHVRQDQLLPG